MTTEPMTLTRALSSANSKSTGLSATFASEWLKLSFLRSTYITLGLGFVLSVASTAIVSFAIGSTQDEWSPNFNPITVSMFGNIFALIVYSVFGVMAMTREYSSGVVRLTLTATPRRRQVLLTKLVIVSSITFVFGVATTVTMFLVGQAILGANGLPTASLADSDAQRFVLGLGAVMPFFPVAGLAIGVLVRSTAGAITAVLGLLWLPVIFGEALPMWFRENIVSLLPGSALDSLTLSHVEPNAANTEPAVAVVIVAAWLAGLLGAAYFAFTRRDA